MANNYSDLSTSTVLTAPSPAASGTSLVVQSGHGTRFPSTSFYATVHPDYTYPTFDNAEIVLVTNVSTDTFTITRAQKSSSAQSIATGWRISAGVYASDLPINKTKTIFSRVKADNTGGANDTTNLGAATAYTGTPTGYGRGQFIVPTDFVSGTSMTLIIAMRSDSTNSSETFRYYIDLHGDGDSHTSWNIASAQTQTESFTANAWHYVTCGTSITGAAAGDIVSFAVTIQTALTGIVYAEAAYLSYTSDGL